MPPNLFKVDEAKNFSRSSSKFEVAKLAVTLLNFQWLWSTPHYFELRIDYLARI